MGKIAEALEDAVAMTVSENTAVSTAAKAEIVATVKNISRSVRATAKFLGLEYNYAQRSINVAEKFGDEGKFSGKTIDELANDLRSGKILSKDVPLSYVKRDGIMVVENTRSTVALERSGISPDK